MTCSSASVDRDTTSYRVLDLNPRRFGIVNTDPRSGIRLEFLVSRCESQDEVRHERARIDPGSHVALSYNVTKAIPQGEVSATAKAIVKEVAFNRGTNYARAEDVTEFNAAEKADVILRVDLQSGIKIPIGWVDIAVVTRKRSGSAAVLIDIRAHVDRTVKTDSVIWWWRRRCNVLVRADGPVSPACKETVRSPIRLKRNNLFHNKVSGELFCDLFNGIVKGVNEILKRGLLPKS